MFAWTVRTMNQISRAESTISTIPMTVSTTGTLRSGAVGTSDLAGSIMRRRT